MQAIILAAGMGKRLKELTKNATKCMVEVNGVTLIQRALTALDQLSLDRIVLVVGYEKETTWRKEKSGSEGCKKSGEKSRKACFESGKEGKSQSKEQKSCKKW